jgi:hypothetical protein
VVGINNCGQIIKIVYREAWSTLDADAVWRNAITRRTENRKSERIFAAREDFICAKCTPSCGARSGFLLPGDFTGMRFSFAFSGILSEIGIIANGSESP